MNSGAARVAPEKAVFRPALPMSFTPGISEMQMDNAIYLGQFTDEDNQQWGATLLLGDGEPVIRLVRENSKRQDTYHLSQFLNIGTRFDRFMVAGPELTDPVYTFGGSSTARIAQSALANITPLNGRFEICWVPNDPSVPF